MEFEILQFIEIVVVMANLGKLRKVTLNVNKIKFMFVPIEWKVVGFPSI